MREADWRKDAANLRASKRSGAVTRGFIGGAVWLVAGLAFTLLVSTFLQYLTIARNNQSAAQAPWSPPETTQGLTAKD